MSSFKRKRVAWAILWLIVLTIILAVLGFSFYRLYIEAEKAQKTAFTGNVLIAGQKISNMIGENIYKQNISLEKKMRSVVEDSTEVRTKTTFLINKRPIALIKETITIYRGETTSLDKDTTYFENGPDSLLADSLFYETFIKDNEQFNINTKNDSLFSSLDRDTLRFYTNEILLKYGINTEADFCIFNVTDNSYVIPPQIQHQDYEIMNNGYVFAIPNDETYSHYLILYFPNERGYFLQHLIEIVIPIVLLIMLIAILVVALILAWMRQKKNEEVKNNFINNITHEFKTPLATISLACEALSDDSIHTDKDSSQAFVKIIKDENDRLQKMVTKILQLARLKKGQLELNQEVINVEEIIDSIAQSIALQVANRDGELIVNYKATQNDIFADRSHIENIFINLIENALKYSAQRPVITIETHNENNMVVVSIADNGIGIAKKELRHIFDEFYRVQKGNVHNASGYGLGLSYVKKIVQLHGGNIMVQSEVKKGSIFTVCLPINK